ncbi:hypothetical protein H4R18_000960 [Coemansia javaensis]|uniref:Uncharacterized protein n=1 Tax=Coemansia javaensis TaxID=2761396 RepID=A0A9W8HLZ4_9FUNG|nr:hypothetical protein H4R18_000960 [Coemansia javaensis]
MSGLASAETLTTHPPAMFAGGRRRSQPETGILRSKKEERSDDKEEGESKDVIRLKQADNEFFKEQLQKQQAHKLMNSRVTNSALNNKPNPVQNGRIRQPATFPKGTPAAFKAAARDLQ